MSKTRNKNPKIDAHVGARVRERRIVLGLTQQAFSKLIGVTYQQGHKYEHGINRISAGRLYEIARVLNVPIGYFFEGIDAPSEPPPRQRLMLELHRNFYNIQNPRLQEALHQLVRTLARGVELD